VSATITHLRAEDRQLVAYLQLIAGPRPGGRLIEIRYATPHGLMRRLFIPARAPDRGARAIGVLAPRNNVYVGVALRCRRAGGRDAVSSSHLAFVEIDAPDAQERLQRFAYAPSIVIASGSAGHLHAYWALRTPVPTAAIEAANRRLAQHLGGDLASVDAARILRPLSVARRIRRSVCPARSFADASPSEAVIDGKSAR